MKVAKWLVVLGWAATCWAQPTELRYPEFLKEYAQTRGFLLGRPVKGKVTRQGDVYFLCSEATSRSQSFYHCKQGKVRKLLSPEAVLGGQDEKLSPEEKARNERKRQLGTGFTEYFLAPDQKSALLPLAGQLILLDLVTGQPRRLNIRGSVLDPQWSPNGQWLAYVKAQDLWVYHLKSGREHPVTRGGTPQKTHGIAEFVAQEEMHRLSGYCWSPDSRRLAFEEADHSGVEIWYISDPLHPENPPLKQYYPRPGKSNVKARLGIASLEGKTTWVNLPGEYLASLQWDRQGPLTVQLQDRSQHQLRLMEVNPDSGQLRLLQQENSPSWVPLHQDVPLWVDRQRYLYLKQRADRMALALCHRQGGLEFLDPTQNYDILDMLAYDSQSQAVLCRVDRQPGNPYLHWIALRGKAPQDPALEGVQEAHYSRGIYVAQEQSMQNLPRMVVWDGAPKALPDQGSQPSLKCRVQFDSVEVGGLKFQAALLRPDNHRPGLRYPVILDVYGGPTKVQVAHNRRAWLMDQWLAEQGFIVVSIDNRGTPGRGRAWETAVYGRFDSVPLDDQMAALKALGQRHADLDLSRVGVWGWSFGGYLAAQAVLKRPDFFAAALAGAPVTDWEDYDTHYTERYLGRPQQQPEAYRKASLIALAGQLQRPLLLVHGSADDNVYYRHSLKLSEALFRAGKPYELLTLPGITHSFRADVGVTEQLWSRSVQFFQKHLGRPS